MGYYKDSPPTMTAELAEVAAQAKSAVTERFTDAQKKQIVTQFYEKHAPGKSPAQIDEILAKPVYQKDAGFVKLCGGLERKYKESPVGLWRKSEGERWASSATASTGASKRTSLATLRISVHWRG